jgi:hypothetical protein
MKYQIKSRRVLASAALAVVAGLLAVAHYFNNSTAMLFKSRNDHHEPRQLSRPSPAQQDRVPGIDKPGDFQHRDWTGRPISVADESELASTHMTPELARILLDRVKSEVASVGDQARISSVITMALCRQGFSAEAWDLVEENPGGVRELQIGTLFLYDQRPLNILVHQLNSLSDPNERVQALRALIVSRPVEISGLDFRDIPLATKLERIHVAASIANAINNASHDPTTAKTLLDKSIQLVREGHLTAGNLISILQRDPVNDGFNQWSALANLNNVTDTNELDRIRSAVVKNMVKSDAAKAMAVLSSSSATKLSYPLLREAIFTMYEVDEIHANEWVNTQLPTVDPETAQRIIASLTQVSIRSGEFDTARQWASRINNTTIRNQVLDQIRTAQVPKPEGLGN